MTWKPARGCRPEDLPDLPPDDPLGQEWKTYKREVARLVAEGNEGRSCLIKGDEIVGMWDSFSDAAAAGFQRFGLEEPFLVREIHAIEPIYRIPQYG
jgi:hypothetical protein